MTRDAMLALVEDTADQVKAQATALREHTTPQGLGRLANTVARLGDVTEQAVR